MSEEIRPKDIEWKSVGPSPYKNLFCNNIDCELCNAFKEIMEAE